MPVLVISQSINVSGSLTICSGASVNLTASGYTGSPSFKWQRDGIDIVPLATSATYAATLSGSYGVLVTLSGTTVPYTPVTVVVNPNPTADFTFSPDGDCANIPITFTSTSSGISLTYAWNFNDPTSGSSNTSIIPNPSKSFIGTSGINTQIFSVKLDITDGNGCISTKTRTINKKQMPSTILDESGGSKTYNNQTYYTSCGSASSALFTFFNNSTTKPNNNYKIIWGNGGPDYNSVSFPNSGLTQTYSSGTYTLVYAVTGANGCIKTDTSYVFVGSNPAVSFGNPGGTDKLCTDDVITFPISGFAANPASTIYSFSVNDGTQSQVFTHPAPATVTHTFSKSSCGAPASNGYTNSFSASIKAENACNSSLVPVYPIYVSQKPTASFTTSSSTTCTNTIVSFNSSATVNTSVNTNGICVSGKSVWLISPSSGYTVVSGTLGDDNNGSAIISSWTTGSTTLSIRFTTAGTYTITLKSGSANTKCNPDQITQTICVNPSPTASFTVDKTTGCNNLSVKTTNTSSLPTCGTNTYLWSVGYTPTSSCLPNTSNFTYNSGSATSVTPEFNFINPGTYSINLTTSNGTGCISPASAAQTIIVKSKPSVTITSSGNICTGSSITPSASVGNCNSSSAATYSWTFNGGTPSSSTNANPGPITYSTTGSFITQLVVTNECGSTTITQTITVNPQPVVTVPANQVKCAGATSGILNFTSTLSGTSYSWSNTTTSIGLASSGTTSSIASFTLANSGAAPIVATISVIPTAGGCAGPSGSFSITVNPKPAIPTVVTPVTYCLNATSVPLTATAASGNTLLWYNSLPPSPPNGGSSSIPTPITTNSGTINYFVTQDNTFGCTSNVSTIAVTVTPLITNNTISSDQTLCAGSLSSVLTGTSPSGGNGFGTYSYQWQSSTDGGTTFTNIASSGTSSNYSPGTLNASTLYKRNVISGACILSSNIVSITIQAALSNTGISASQDICEGNPIATLIGLIPTGGNGTPSYQWDSSLNNSTWIPITGAVSKDYLPLTTTNTAYYQRRIVSGNCNATSPSSVKITIFNKPKAGTLSSPLINTCFASNISITTSGVVGSIQKWQYNFTPANTATWRDTSVTNTSINFNNVQASFGVRVIVLQSGICTNRDTSAVTQVNVANTTNPGTTGTDATVCTGGNSGTINLTGQSGTILRWETSTNGNTYTPVANTATSLIYTNLTVTTWYRAVVQSGTCPSSNSNSTKITVVPTVTSSNAGVDQSLCNQTSVTLNGNTPSVGTGIWSQTSGPSVTIVNPSLANTQITGLVSSQTYKFVWTIAGTGSCPSTSDEVQIINTPTITQSTLGPDQTICNFTSKDSINLTGNSINNPAFENGLWSILSPIPTGSLPVIRSITNPNSNFIFDKSGTYRLIWTISNGVCISTKDTITVIVYDKPAAGILNASTKSVCVGNDVIISTGNGLTGNIAKWQYNYSAGNTNVWTDSLITTNSITFKNIQQSFDIRVIVKSSGIAGGCALFDTSSISINAIPDFTNIIDTTSSSICAGQTVSITGLIPTGGSGGFQYQWQQSSDGNVWSNMIGQTNVNLTSSPVSSIYFRRIVTFASCFKNSLPVYVLVRPLLGNFQMSDSTGTCFPFSITFTNIVLPSTLTTWSFGDGAFNQGDIVTHTYNSTGTFQVKMTSQYPGGCKFEATKTVTLTGPTGVFKYDHDKICGKQSVQFQVSSSNIDSVKWNFGDGISTVIADKLVYHQYLQPGTFVPSFELLAGPGGLCKTKFNGPDTLFVDYIKAGFKTTNLNECTVTHTAFTDTSRAFGGIKSYSWSLGDGSSSIERNPTHDYYASSVRNIREIVYGNSGCTDTANFSIPIRVWNIPQVKTNTDTSACVGQIVNYAASIFSPDAIKSTIWNFSNGSGASTISYPKAYSFPGTYMAIFIATTINDCSDTARLPINIYATPTVNLGSDRILSTGTLLPLNTIVSNGPIATWDWKPTTNLSCNNCATPTANIKNDISYILNATDTHGCNATDTINIKVFCESTQVYIPSVFTPDNDGLNDILMVRGTGIRTIKYFRIFNRWGEVVFERSNFTPNEKSNGWDGKVKNVPAPPDIYVYTCEVICDNGNSFTYKGNTSIVK